MLPARLVALSGIAISNGSSFEKAYVHMDRQADMRYMIKSIRTLSDSHISSNFSRKAGGVALELRRCNEEACTHILQQRFGHEGI
ncbi:hypothetical protein AVEN_197851-1 [Araneus ventricosus]|uniref:Uncharacterized protein n=1 Tax=Araneus ventricosus TaxID=182803 RepID=A0A4Y2QDI7_ARAVE|nr:hypothetical protein AVEN_197851-1 [Araneus ventricosus]